MKILRKSFKVVGLSLLLCIFLAMAAFAAAEEPAAESSVEFTDVAGHIYENEINAMHEGGYAIGFTDGSFRPGRSFTRVELAQLIADILSLDTSAKTDVTFTDIEISGEDAIKAVVAAGLMEGRSAQNFEPYDSVLKAELYDTLEKSYQSLDITDLSLVMDEELLSWSSDYTVLNAGEAMHGCYYLAETVRIQEEAELNASLASAEPDTASEEPAEDATASEEPVSADSELADDEATEVTDENTADATDLKASEEPVQEDASGEMTDTSAAEETEENAASNEPADDSTVQEATSTTTTEKTTQTESKQPAASAVETTTPTAEEASTTADAPASSSVPESKADEIRQIVYDKYAEIRDSLVDLLKSAVDAIGLG